MGTAYVTVNGKRYAVFEDSAITGRTGQQQAEAFLDEFAGVMRQEGKTVKVTKVR